MLGEREITFSFLGDSEYEQGEAFSLELSAGGASRDSLLTKYPGLPIEDALKELDEGGFLTESPSISPEGITGKQLYREARRVYDAVIAQAAEIYPRQISQKLLDDTVTQAELIGYAIEYYHVVAFCPRVLAPGLTHADDYETTMAFRRFYQAEQNHDRMLLKSLSAVGIDPRRQAIQPLPATFSMMTSLGIYAYHFPLAMKATLFVLEEPQLEFNEAFLRNAKRLGLPQDFWKPISAHSDVNDDEEHEAISLDLMSTVEYVGAEEAHEVLLCVADMCEHLVATGQEISGWYGESEDVRLRVW
ncbi:MULTISPECIES: iron-containing redox enzyme family protein [Rhodococcus]|uniref:iron-containing redox enzyme family protein n=1 Tax=Rhodococcus TaxID=1827 RepID=UPI001F5C999C|nr:MULTISPECIES: iron-containing redox enzyme family protein [Rhodococcus]UTT51134.1 iron-containing redox enzyme family protein [Rhodococcus gordoniae]